MKLTDKYLIRSLASKKQFLVRRKNESDKHFLNRLTHLYLQDQFIDQIAKITVCQNVSVIYLHNNMLRSFKNIQSFPNLTHLYLQRNYLMKIEYLEYLQNLKKIYLGFNEITVLEGFADLPKIKEIHIECQDLPAGETLLFEPQTLHNLGTTLQVLNISENNLSSLCELKSLVRLEVLVANGNRLRNLADVTNTLKEWPFLKKLSLIGNPVTDQRWYRDGIIFASKSLEILDDKNIRGNTRKFIEKLTEHRKSVADRKNEGESSGSVRRKAEAEEAKESKSVTFREESCAALPGTFATSGFDPGSSFPAWQLRNNLNPVNQKNHLPRPYWKKGGIHAFRGESSTPKQFPRQGSHIRDGNQV